MLKFTLVCDFLFPAMMLLFGLIFWKLTPQKPNAWYGYRTKLSVRTKETWIFAHHYFGRIWLVLGAVVLAGTAAAVFYLLNEGGELMLENWSLPLLVVQLIILVLPISPTEYALRKQFDKYGCPVNEEKHPVGRHAKEVAAPAVQAAPAEKPADTEKEEIDYGPEAGE